MTLIVRISDRLAQELIREIEQLPRENTVTLQAFRGHLLDLLETAR